MWELASIGWCTRRNLLQNSPLALGLVKKERSRLPSAPRLPLLPISFSQQERSFRSECILCACGKRASSYAWERSSTGQPCLQPKGYILTDQRPNAREKETFSNPLPWEQVCQVPLLVLNSVHLVNGNKKGKDLRSETCTWWMQMKMSLPSSYVWLGLWEWAFIEAGPTADLFLSTCPRTPVTQPRKRWAANTLLSTQHTEACIFLYEQCHQPQLHSTVARKIQFNTAVCMVYLPWKPVWNPFTFIFF